MFMSHHSAESQISHSIQTDIHGVHCILDISTVDPNSARAKSNLLPTLCPRNQTAEMIKHSLLYLDSLSVDGPGVHPSAQAKHPRYHFYRLLIYLSAGPCLFSLSILTSLYSLFSITTFATMFQTTATSHLEYCHRLARLPAFNGVSLFSPFLTLKPEWSFQSEGLILFISLYHAMTPSFF